MSRKIEFRGLCEQSKEWVFGDLIHGVGSKEGNLYILPVKRNLAYIKHCDPLDGVKVIPESVGQLIGVKDMFDQDIYQGDALASEYNEEIFIVKYWDGGFCGDNSGFKHGTLSAHEMRRSKKIGNLFDNPELINTGE